MVVSVELRFWCCRWIGWFPWWSWRRYHPTDKLNWYKNEENDQSQLKPSVGMIVFSKEVKKTSLDHESIRDSSKFSWQDEKQHLYHTCIAIIMVKVPRLLLNRSQFGRFDNWQYPTCPFLLLKHKIYPNWQYPTGKPNEAVG